MNEKMSKLLHFCGVCQDEINERLGYQAYSYELRMFNSDLCQMHVSQC